MRIDIWTDIVCPFCFIGKRHLELALENFEHRDDIELAWHSFELDPTIAREAGGPLAEKIAQKFSIPLEQSEQAQRDVAAQAATVGLEFNWEQAQYGNTFNAHRLVHLAAHHGLATQAQTRLMRAYFTEGINIADHDALQRLGAEIGLPTDAVHSMLSGDEYGQAVRADEAQAGEMGISGVPFFVFDGKYAISGAQPVETFAQALHQMQA